ncbi:PRA1 family protein F3-like [Phoenix dactylifera]|uniref:PRA1 family protein n=1 Tax=Phoenix dactylifera TaxID=42345 RepID=A0A8B8ZEH3_PHODC|nr:PRA1 family protein F3-like [Phoenix dactylifera]
MKTTSPSGYGTIHTAAASSPPSAAAPKASAFSRATEMISRFREQGQSLIAARRPWWELLDPAAVHRPLAAGDAASRLRRNIAYFRANYTIVILLAVFLSLIWHPPSLIAFVALSVAWFFLYSSHDRPLVLFGRAIDEGTVLTALSVITVVALVVTDVAWNLLASIMVGLAIVGIHAVFRTTDDLFLDEQEAARCGLLSVAGSRRVVRQADIRVV